MKTEIKELKRFNVLSVAKIFLICGIIMGLLQGILYGYSAQQTIAQYPDVVDMTFADAQTAGGSEAVTMLMVVKLGWWSLLAMPIFVGIFAWLGGVISAWIYNVIARKFGGIKFVLN
jgi:uncharacterized membrane protein